MGVIVELVHYGTEQINVSWHPGIVLHSTGADKPL